MASRVKPGWIGSATKMQETVGSAPETCKHTLGHCQVELRAPGDCPPPAKCLPVARPGQGHLPYLRAMPGAAKCVGFPGHPLRPGTRPRLTAAPCLSLSALSFLCVSSSTSSEQEASAGSSHAWRLEASDSRCSPVTL